MTKPLEPSQKKGKSSKLTENDVRTIREMYQRGTQSVRQMAQFYGVAAETVRRALRGETWNDLHMAPFQIEAEIAAGAAASFEKLQRLLAAEKERKGAGDKMLDELASTTPRSPLDE